MGTGEWEIIPGFKSFKEALLRIKNRSNLTDKQISDFLSINLQQLTEEHVMSDLSLRKKFINFYLRIMLEKYL